MTDETGVMNTLFGSRTVPVESLGRSVEIKRLSLRTSQPVTDLVSSLIKDLADNPESLRGLLLTGNQDGVIRITADQLLSIGFILKLISTRMSEAVEIAALLTDLTGDQLMDLELHESLSVIEAIVSVNKGYFEGKIKPVLGALMSGVFGEEEAGKAPTTS